MSSIDEAARHALYRVFEELIGPEHAATFMAMMAFDPDELATADKAEKAPWNEAMGVRAAPTMTTSDMRWSSSIVGRRGRCGRICQRRRDGACGATGLGAHKKPACVCRPVSFRVGDTGFEPVTSSV